MPHLYFTCDPQYSIYQKVYQAIWSEYGKKITSAFEDTVHLPFNEKKINAIVGSGDCTDSNFAGNSIKEPMLFRYSVRDKLGTICHELGHRLILEYDYFKLAKSILKISNDHQLLDLFLYDVIGKALGKAAAEERLKYESSFPEDGFRTSWEWAMKFDYKSRQKLLILCSQLIR